MRKTYTLILTLIITCPIFAADIWVSTNGNDKADGSIASPKATLSAALRQARELRRQNNPSIKNGINIIIKEGTYSLYEPVFIRPEDSGTKESPTIIKSAHGERVSLSGGVNITNWKKSKGKLWETDVPIFNGRPLDFRQLWINDKKTIRARDVIDLEKMNRIISENRTDEPLTVPVSSVKKILKAPYTEIVLLQQWCIANLRIKSIEVVNNEAHLRFHNPESRIQFEHPWPRPITEKGRESVFYLTNAFELLDEPGEWYHDIETRKLYYYPREDENMNNIKAVVPAIETLVKVEGTLDNPVENIYFDNISFNHTTWMRPSEKGHVPLQAGMYMLDAYQVNPQIELGYGNPTLDNQAWLGRAPGAVTVSGAKYINFLNCSFEHLGSSGLDYTYGVYGGIVEGCYFRDIAGSGIVTGTFSQPSHETHIYYDPTDRREICTHQTIKNNLLTDIANEDFSAVGIIAGYVSDINIEHNEINDVAYSGISVGWGWVRTINCMRNNRVHANLIYNFGKHLDGVGGLYTLSAQPNTFFTDNYVHSAKRASYTDQDYWFYIYADIGSSYIVFQNNYLGQPKTGTNHNGPLMLWENNGPMVNDSVKTNAGLTPQYKHLQKNSNQVLPCKPTH